MMSLPSLLHHFGGDLEDLLRGVIRSEGRIVAVEFRDLAAFWQPVDDFEFARRVPRQRDFTVAPDARAFGVILGAEAIQAAVAAFGQIFRTFWDVAELDVWRR